MPTPKSNGFQPLTDEGVLNEAHNADTNDDGIDNTLLLQSRKPNGRQVVEGYVVAEESARKTRAALTALNAIKSVIVPEASESANGIQSVTYLNKSDRNDSVSLVSTVGDTQAILTGSSDGRVFIKVAGDDVSIKREITAAAAKAGITAAGLRMMEKGMIADGEISATEQQQIINTINKALKTQGITLRN